MRTFKTIGIVLGMYAAGMVMEIVMAINSPDYQVGISIIVILAILGFMGPKVGCEGLELCLSSWTLYEYIRS